MKIIFFVFMSLLFINIVIALDFNYSINQSKLPLSFDDNLSILTDFGSNFTFTHYNFTSSIPSINLNETTNIFNLSFTVSLPNLSIGNYFTLFTITKNLTKQLNITLGINILNDTVINQTNQSKIGEIGFNRYGINECDINLPFNSFISVPITLEVDINPVCDNFLLCPPIIYPNETNVIINISIPQRTAIGHYTRYALFGSNIGNLTFEIEIKDCLFDITQICGTKNLSNINELFACHNALLENLKKINRSITVNNTIIEYVNNTQIEYREVLNLSEDNVEILSNLREIATNMRTAQSDVQRLTREKDEVNTKYQSDLQSMQQELSRLNSELEVRVKQVFSNLIIENKNLTITNQNLEAKTFYKSTIFWIFFSILIISLSVYSFFYIRKEMII